MQQLFFEMLQAWYALNVAVALMGFRTVTPIASNDPASIKQENYEMIDFQRG